MKKFYQYSQNNSGGSFTVDDKLCHQVFIEANSSREADDIAESIGIYFNGCDEGYDCPCCGDRWYSGDEIEFPHRYGAFTEENAKSITDKYGCSYDKTKHKGYRDRKYDVIFETVEQYAQYMADEYGWTDPDGRVFYSDGKVEEIRSRHSK